jgi:hypothetical protein
MLDKIMPSPKEIDAPGMDFEIFSAIIQMIFIYFTAIIACYAIDSFIRPRIMQLHMHCRHAKEAIECITSYGLDLSILKNNEKNADLLIDED